MPGKLAHSTVQVRPALHSIGLDLGPGPDSGGGRISAPGGSGGTGDPLLHDAGFGSFFAKGPGGFANGVSDGAQGLSVQCALLCERAGSYAWPWWLSSM
jgi:hypothetical protein